ncbi:MAG: phage tail protein, partial [Actinomycetota bacterium]|nr:phage tail protein [Actinomycetota bacterium]
CTVEIGSSIGQSFKDWIKASLDGKHVRKSGAIIAADFDYAERSRREFREALITEVGFPALDAASKETAFLTVTFAPELIERKAGSGQKLLAEKTKQKPWLKSNFRFEIKGLPTSKVNKIDAFTIKQTMVTDGIGESRDQQKEPGKLEFPNLAFTLAESDAQPWYDWFDDFVLRGNNGPDKEKTGVLEFVDPSRTDVLLAVEFRGLGIFKVASDTSEAGEQAIRRIKVELYCESLTVAFTGGSG